MRTSILIPCFNESEGVPQLCERLRLLVQRLGSSHEVEIVFIDDGSNDGTADDIRREAQDLPYRIVSHDHNRGIGAALRTGFQVSKGDEIVTLDSDCTYDPLQATELLNVLRSGYDVVTGSPYHPLGRVLGVEAWRLFLSKAASRLYWMMLPMRLYTYTSCFRAYRREVLPALDTHDDGFIAVTATLVSAILQGAKVAEVPVTLASRRFGRSKIRVIAVAFSHMLYVVRVLKQKLASRRQRGVEFSREVISTTIL